MANSIELVKKYVNKLDDVYKLASLTDVLESDSATVRNGTNTNEIVIPKIDMDGLADYSRSGGYVEGDDKLTWETVKFDYDRGRSFSVDAMDNEETIGISFGMLSSRFVRNKVVPEMDAYRFAKYAGKSGITVKSENLVDGEAVCRAITEANNVLDEAEVDTENRILFITPTLHNAIIALDTYKSKAMLESFSTVVKVPQTRFYTAIDLLDGKSSGEEIGGYKKATAGKNINFMIIDKSAVLQFTKHVVNKVIAPEDNQTADSWKFFYRAYGLTDVYENKVKGIYCSHSAN
ncbi:MAG: hypothetical protein NC177_05685 [Ruminococcus flavefaciens]|nr:hypothetical protein [Ruminococcus flavefaciens]